MRPWSSYRDLQLSCPHIFTNPTWLKLVHTAGADLDERVAEVVG